MKITVLYNNFADNDLGLKSKTFDCKGDKDMITMILWLTATEGLPGHPVARKVHELIINGVRFKTDTYLNPSDWAQEIKQALREEGE